MSIILFIIVLTLLIFVHELGHFIAAKRAGVRVDEFGIGFPPRLWKKKVGETVYSFNAFPVGGFVKIFGENPDDESLRGKDKARSLSHKPKLTQAWIISAGIVFNVMLAWSLISAGFMVGLPFSTEDERYGARVVSPELVITQVIQSSPAESAGLKAGDKIRSLTAGKKNVERPSSKEAQQFIGSHDEVLLAYVRGSEAKSVLVRPRDGLVNGKRAIGISMDTIGTLKLPFYEAFYAGTIMTADLTWMTIAGLADFFMNMFIGNANFTDVAGPVGIAGIVGDASALGFVHLISLVALISINLAVLNLLPFPALDGGRLFFLLIETIKGSPIRPVVANTANGIGFILLILFMVAVTYSDIAKLIN